jgi:hypothetical protein
MPTTPVPDTPPNATGQQFMTEEDARAQFASVLWYEAANAAGQLDEYQNTNVAILGDRILDEHPDLNELHRRLDALGDTIPQFQVVVRYRGMVKYKY